MNSSPVPSSSSPGLSTATIQPQPGSLLIESTPNLPSTPTFRIPPTFSTAPGSPSRSQSTPAPQHPTIRPNAPELPAPRAAPFGANWAAFDIWVSSRQVNLPNYPRNTVPILRHLPHFPQMETVVAASPFGAAGNTAFLWIRRKQQLHLGPLETSPSSESGENIAFIRIRRKHSLHPDPAKTASPFGAAGNAALSRRGAVGDFAP